MNLTISRKSWRLHSWNLPLRGEGSDIRLSLEDGFPDISVIGDVVPQASGHAALDRVLRPPRVCLPTPLVRLPEPGPGPPQAVSALPDQTRNRSALRCSLRCTTRWWNRPRAEGTRPCSVLGERESPGSAFPFEAERPEAILAQIFDLNGERTGV